MRLHRQRTWLVNAVMAVYLGCVLPWICWGMLATPGHPHGGPHLVFAPPPERPAQAQAPAAEARHQGHHQGHQAAGQPPAPAGQSTPKLAILGLPLMPLPAPTLRVRPPATAVPHTLVLGSPAWQVAPATPPRGPCAACL